MTFESPEKVKASDVVSGSGLNGGAIVHGASIRDISRDFAQGSGSPYLPGLELVGTGGTGPGPKGEQMAAEDSARFTASLGNGLGTIRAGGGAEQGDYYISPDGKVTKIGIRIVPPKA
jgi:hypothetical protein